MQNVMTDEVWKDIEDYGGKYMVSNQGRVKSCQRNKILKNQIGSHGYYCVSLCNDGEKTSHLVHRLVAVAFLSNPKSLPYVNHIDENKLNPSIGNLEWCTEKHNAQHSHGIVVRFTNQYGITHSASSIRLFAELHKLDETCLSRVNSGLLRQHKGWTNATTR